MLRSMTGYGSSHGQINGVEYAVEARSVNNRYFKAAVKVPECLASVEPRIEQLLRETLYRGTVTLTVRMKLPDEQAAYRVNTAALAKYIEQLRPLEIEANPMLRVDLGSLLQLPGVCEPPPLDDLLQRTQEGLLECVRTALDQLIEMRKREGKGLKADLLSQCETIRQNVKTVAKRSPQVVLEYRDRLESRVRELLNGGSIPVDSDSLAHEVAMFAERCDIAEEINRLTGHVEQFEKTVASPEPAGRKLDFIAQEMLREANTMGSKSNDAEIARSVVEIKTAVDRIKEQVQNAE